MVDLSVEDGIAWLTLNRPEALNAINIQGAQQFASHAEELRNREDVRVVVTQGAGRAFCAGSDLKEIGSLSPSEAAQIELEKARAFALLDTLPQPTIAMLHGHVLGGGLGLALYHDFRIAASNTSFGLPEVELGWTPPWPSGRLVDTVGGANARWLALTGIRLSADEVISLGLVHQVVEDEHLKLAVTELSRRLAEMPPEGMRRTKALIVRMSPLRDPHWDEEAAAEFEKCYGTDEARKNVATFLSRDKE